MELYRKVRLACRDGMSERAAARHFGVSRQSVRKMLEFSVPPGYRRTAPVRRPKLDEFTALIEQWLEDDRRHGYPNTSRTHRWPASRMHRTRTRPLWPHRRGVPGRWCGRQRVDGREGWAVASRKYSTDYVSHETAAKATRRGVWRGQFVVPSRWRRGDRLEAAGAGGAGDCRIRGGR